MVDERIAHLKNLVMFMACFVHILPELYGKFIFLSTRRTFPFVGSPKYLNADLIHKSVNVK